MTLFWLAIGVAVGVVGTLPLLLVMLRRAVHRAREAEGEARHSQRLSELGSMTSGLAHEIRNPLSTVGLNAQLLHEDLASADLDPEQRERLMHRIDSLAREVDRLGHILGDHRAGAGDGAVADSEGSHQHGVGPDEDVFADLGAVLLSSVVVARDRAGSNVGPGTDGGVSEVCLVVRLGTFSDRRVLGLDERADLRPFLHDGALPKRSVRANLAGFADDGRPEHGIPDFGIGADRRVEGEHVRADPGVGGDRCLTLEMDAGIDPRTGFDSDCVLDIGVIRVHDPHP